MRSDLPPPAQEPPAHIQRAHGQPPAQARVAPVAAAAVVALCALIHPVSAAGPNFGPNVLVFDPSMPVSSIKAQVAAVAAKQLSNEFGQQRYALLFMPGTYGSASAPLNFQLGYYTAVAGLGRSPTDVVTNGSINVYNQCANGSCTALNNSWRSLSNLTINVTDPQGAGCYAGNFWAVSKAAPLRRVNVTGGNLTLMDYCTGPSFANGGFIADSRTAFVINGSQQQWMVRDSEVGGWSNGVWNQVFSGVVGAPGECFPSSAGCAGPYTTLAASPVTREAPYLVADATGQYQVFVPAPRRLSSGTTWANGPTPGRSIPIEQFFIAKPTDRAQDINNALARGLNLIFTPGIYAIDNTIKVKRAGTVVLGLGFATLVSQNGVVPMTVAGVPGVSISGLIFDAGAANSPLLLQVGPSDQRKGSADDPTVLHDLSFRIGGASSGKAEVSLEVNSDHVILDNIWAWRADRGNGVGWTMNTATTGIVVNGNHVSAYGLFVENFQKTEVAWNGNEGSIVFLQNQMPPDPPSQSAWMQPGGAFGWPALKVADSATRFNGYGMGSYSAFNQGINIYASNAFEVPTTLPPGSLHNLLTIFLNPASGAGGILNVVNGIGGSSTIANPDVPVTVVNYP